MRKFKSRMFIIFAVFFMITQLLFLGNMKSYAFNDTIYGEYVRMMPMMNIWNVEIINLPYRQYDLCCITTTSKSGEKDSEYYYIFKADPQFYELIDIENQNSNLQYSIIYDDKDHIVLMDGGYGFGLDKIADPKEHSIGFIGYGQVVNCLSSITLRSGPSTSYSEIRQIPLGQIGEIYNGENGFYYAIFDGIGGYVLDSYINTIS